MFKGYIRVGIPLAEIETTHSVSTFPYRIKYRYFLKLLQERNIIVLTHHGPKTRNHISSIVWSIISQHSNRQQQMLVVSRRKTGLHESRQKHTPKQKIGASFYVSPKNHPTIQTPDRTLYFTNHQSPDDLSKSVQATEQNTHYDLQ